MGDPLADSVNHLMTLRQLTDGQGSCSPGHVEELSRRPKNQPRLTTGPMFALAFQGGVPSLDNLIFDRYHPPRQRGRRT